MTRNFQYEVEVFIKEIIFNGWLGENKIYHSYWMGSPHVHLFIWFFNAPNIENEAACIEFVRKQ